MKGGEGFVQSDKNEGEEHVTGARKIELSDKMPKKKLSGKRTKKLK